MVQTDINHKKPLPPDEISQTYTLFCLQTQYHLPIIVAPNIEGHSVSLELDTGAVINKLAYNTILAAAITADV